MVPKFINRCLWDRSRNDVSQAAEIGRLGIYLLFFVADIGRPGAKGLRHVNKPIPHEMREGDNSLSADFPQILS
jgi:hypothetical protein